MAYKIVIKEIAIPEDIRENARVIYSVQKNDKVIYEIAEFADANKLSNIIGELNNAVVNQITKREALEAIDTAQIEGEYDVEKTITIETELTNDVLSEATELPVIDTAEFIENEKITVDGEEVLLKTKTADKLSVSVLTKNHTKGEKVKQTRTTKL